MRSLTVAEALTDGRGTFYREPVSLSARQTHVGLYDGSQLCSLFAHKVFGILGDSCVAWRAPCDVSLIHMVDLVDRAAEEVIAGSDMIHFIIEIFGATLSEMVFRQRLFASIVGDITRGMDGNGAGALWREGDDLFLPDVHSKGPRKLSVSVATVSPVSGLIHFAVNVSEEGTPVPTVSLNSLGIDVAEWTTRVLSALQAEEASIFEAACKVAWVR